MTPLYLYMKGSNENLRWMSSRPSKSSLPRNYLWNTNLRFTVFEFKFIFNFKKYLNESRGRPYDTLGLLVSRETSNLFRFSAWNTQIIILLLLQHLVNWKMKRSWKLLRVNVIFQEPRYGPNACSSREELTKKRHDRSYFQWRDKLNHQIKIHECICQWVPSNKIPLTWF